MIHFVIGIAVSKDNIVLIRKNRPEWQAGRINFPGGKIEINEKPEDCIVREFKEETGVETIVSDWTLLGTIGRNGGIAKYQFLAYIYYAESEKFNFAKTVESEEIMVIPRSQFLTDRELIKDYLPNLLWFYHFSQSQDRLDYGTEFAVSYGEHEDESS